MSRHLEKIKVITEHRCFEPGLVIELNAGVNLFVGDQGCGKSTLLSGLEKHDGSWVEVEISDFVRKNSIETFYFDTEKQNPRIQQSLEHSKDIGSALLSHFQSHGETLVAYTVNALKKAKNCIIFLDEPESGLSIRNQYALVESLKLAVTNNCQIFIATHCLPVIESFGTVYSLEHKEWMASSYFIETQKNSYGSGL